MYSHLQSAVVVMFCGWFGVPAAAIGAPSAFEIGPSNTDQLPAGKEADGIIGDYVLVNDRVVATISGHQHLRRANMSTFYGPDGITPGCLFDLTFREEQNDQITYFGPAGQRGPVSMVRIISDGRDGKAIVRTERSAASNQGLAVTHDYILEDGWQHVLVVTTFSNQSPGIKTVNALPKWSGLADQVVIDGITVADSQDAIDKQGYAFGPVAYDGATEPLQEVTIPSGQQRTYAVALAVGHSPAEACGVLATLDKPAGTLSGRIAQADEAPAIRATLEIPISGKKIKAYPDENGRFSIRLPVGEYEATAVDLGRPDVTKKVRIIANQTTEASWTVAPASRVTLRVTENGTALPCKVQFNGLDSTPTPNLGTRLRARGCDHQYHSADGAFTQQLPPGKYQLIITHGIEYNHVEKVIELPAGKEVTVQAELKRIVDTTGWVSTDYHNHSTPSGDNYCGTDDRIINLAAEHVEFAPTTEHNRFYDWKPHIEKLGLTKHLSTIVGIELTGGGPHLNSFPHDKSRNRYAQDGGAPVWVPDPRINAMTLRDLPGRDPSRWVHLNHPLVGQYFRDRDADGIADGGYIGLENYVDAAETWSHEILSGKAAYQSGDRRVENRTFAWLQLLNQGRRMWCLAVSDAHAVFGNGVGGWRTYVPSSTDEPAKIDYRENIRNAKAGRMIITNGPFLQVLADDGTMPGGTTIAEGGLTLHVNVQCTTWIDIDRVQVLVNGRAEPDLNFTREKNAADFSDGIVKFDRDIKVPLAADAHLIVVAYGEKFNLKTGYGRSWQSGMHPCAYNNPIFVDVDQDGWKPSGETLGHPLVTGKP